MLSQLLSAQDVWERLGSSKATFFRSIVVDPGFPIPILVGKRKRWRVEDIEAWIIHQTED